MLPHVNNGGGDEVAVPALYEGPDGRPGPVMYTLEVDGQLFAVRSSHDGRYGLRLGERTEQGLWVRVVHERGPARGGASKEHPQLPQHD